VRQARGTGGPYLRGATWWLRVHVAGRKVRISTGLQGGSPGKPPKAVLQAWAEKLAEIGRGNLVALDASVRWEHLAEALVTRYKAEGRLSSLRNAERMIRRWAPRFRGHRAIEITEEAILAHAVHRRDVDGAAVATVNLELRLLRRAFRLLRKRLPALPQIQQLPGARVRQGTVPEEAREAAEARMAPHAAAAVLFLRLTGWRTNEACRLEWRHVDWRAHLLRLETSKNGEPRLYAFRTYRRLVAVLRLQRRRQHAAGVLTPYVFAGLSGERLSAGALRAAWTRARAAGGYAGGLHDLRRTRVQEQDAQGMPLLVGMSLVGMKSVATYRKYAGVSIADQEEWLGRLEEAPQTQAVRPFARRKERS
jgi:integrase